jgi:hypothetical protein
VTVLREVALFAASRARWLRAAETAFVAVGGAVLYGLFIARSEASIPGLGSFFTLFDDAMVSMRYAANLAHGHGLVWNLTGHPVEGYTNFLWTLWMAFLHAVGLSGSSASLGVMITGAVLLLATAVAAGAVARGLTDAPGVPLLAMLLTALAYPLVFWTLRGMEVGLLACLLVVGTVLALRLDERPSRRDAVLLAVVVAAATLTRDDAALLALVLAAWLILASRTRRYGLAVAAVVLLTVALHVVLRLALYGNALPNTYYLKLGGIPLGTRLDRGLWTLRDVADATLWLPIVLAVTAVVSRRRALRRPGLLAAVVLVGFAYSVYVGGDAWEWFGYANRYLSVVLPLLLILASCGVGELLRASTRGRIAFVGAASAALAVLLTSHADTTVRVTGGVGAAVLVLAAQLSRAALVSTLVALAAAFAGSTDWHAYAQWAHSNAESVAQDALYTKTGVLLGQHTPSDATIAVVTAGAMPYYANRYAIDMLGKNDRHVAHLKPHPGPLYPGHNKWDYDYSIGKLRPDIVVQLWSDPPSSAQMADWGYVQVGYLWVHKGGRVDPATVVGLYP